MGVKESLQRWRFSREVRQHVRPERFAAYGTSSIVHSPLHVEGADRVSIGEQTFILSHASIVLGPSGRLAIGSRTYLGRDLTILALGEVTIGDDVMGSDRLVIADSGPQPDRHGVPVRDQAWAPARPVHIEDGVFLGTGAMVLAGVTVGARTLVAAGAVVTRDVPPNCVVAGNPARVMRHYDPTQDAWVDGQPASSN